PADLQNAQNAVDNARAALASAQAKRDALAAGPSGGDVQNASNSVDSAGAALSSAVAKRNQLLGGPLPSDVALQEQSVVQADLNVHKAEYDLQNATLTAPFDGTVSAVVMNVG